MNFDIAQLDTRTASEAGVAMPILNPRSGAPLLGADGKPVTITLLGPASVVFKTKQREVQLRRADMSARGVKMTDEDFDAERQGWLTTLTRGWTFDAMGGQPFPYTPENAAKFYADKRWEWVTNAAWRFVNEDGNYLPFLIKRLVWWAEGEFRKLKPLPEGGTLGDAFVSYRRATGKPHPKDAEQISAPEALIYLWNWFWELAQGRTLGPEGVQMPISSLELFAWSQLAGVRLQPWELTALRALDGAYLRIAAEKGV